MAQQGRKSAFAKEGFSYGQPHSQGDSQVVFVVLELEGFHLFCPPGPWVALSTHRAVHAVEERGLSLPNSVPMPYAWADVNKASCLIGK